MRKSGYHTPVQVFVPIIIVERRIDNVMEIPMEMALPLPVSSDKGGKKKLTNMEISFNENN